MYQHFIGNEQETHRNPLDDVASVSSNIDDQTMHELYVWYVHYKLLDLFDCVV